MAAVFPVRKPDRFPGSHAERADGLRVPPRIAPWQVVVVPMLRDGP